MMATEALFDDSEAIRRSCRMYRGQPFHTSGWFASFPDPLYAIQQLSSSGYQACNLIAVGLTATLPHIFVTDAAGWNRCFFQSGPSRGLVVAQEHC